MSVRLRVALTFALLVTAAACTPRIRIDRMQPPRLQLAPNQPVALMVEADGAAPSATNVMDTAIGITRGQILNKWLAVEPVRNELNAELRRNSFSVVDRGSAQWVIRVKPVSWHYELRLNDDNTGRVGTGRLDALVEVRPANDPNAAPIFADTYWARSHANDLGEPEAMLRASRRIAQLFVADTFPQRVYANVELDDSDPAVKPGIELCQSGKFEAAYAAFSDVVARSPDSAPALYDLGVLAEAKGNYDEAEAVLLKATKIASKAIYYDAIERVRQARADAQALQPH